MSAQPVAFDAGPFEMQRPQELLSELRDVLDAVGSLPYLVMSRAELADHVIELQEAAAQMDAVMAEATAAAHDASVHLIDGLLSLPAFVAAHGNAEPKRVAGDRNLGLWLHAFPVFADAFRAGRITRQHAQALRGLDNARTRRALHDAQDYLVRAAATASWTDFCEILRTWLLAADPDGNEPNAHRDRRHLSVSKRPDGSVRGTFDLDPLHGDLVMNGVAQEEQRLLHNENNGERDGDDERTPAQRRADALVNLVGRGATRPDGRTAAPLVHITMGETVATDLLARLAIEADTDDPIEIRSSLLALGLDPDALPLDPTTPQGRCHLADGTTIHPRFAAAALATATLRRLVLSSDNEILQLGTLVRDFPRHFKDAVIAANKGRCTHTGCDAPTAWLQADHRTPHSRQGPTNIDNCQALCAPHNARKGANLPP